MRVTGREGILTYGIAIDNGDGTQRIENSGKVILKNIENRSWPVPAWFKLPQRIQVHAGKRADDIIAVMDYCIGKLGLPAWPIILSFSGELQNRGIVLTSETEEERQMLEGIWNQDGRPGMKLNLGDGQIGIIIAPDAEVEPVEVTL